MRQRAVRLLARREHTQLELARKLQAHGTDEEIAQVMRELQSCNLQSDQRFAEAYVRSHAARLGAARLRQTLRSKGVSPDEVAEQLAGQLTAETAGDERERAYRLWQRKFSKAPADAKEWARQARFLQSRGFGSEIIRNILRDCDSTEDAGDTA